MKKRVLGKGLDALIKGVKEENIRRIPAGKIVPGKYQPRVKITKQNLQELIDSIREKGILEPIIVRPSGENFEIVSGHRRFYAAKELSMEEVPCIVKEISDEEALEIALIENIQREDLNPVEQARAYRILNEKFGLTHEEIAKRVGKTRSAITNTLRILTLAPEIISAIESGKITEGHARALLSLKSENERHRVFKSMLKQKISVRKAERLVKKNKSKEVVYLEEKLKEETGLKFEIKKGKKSGYIKIFFENEEDFEFILKRFLK